MWLFFALLAALCFAVVHVMDAYCVEELFERPWHGVITSSIASITIFLVLPFIAPFYEWDFPHWRFILAALAAGILIQSSQAFYFNALAYSEAGIVAAYWNMIPAMLPLAGLIFFGTVFEFPKYIGIAILTVASIAMCLLDSNFVTRWNSFFLMFVASLMQVIAYLLEDIVFDHTPFIVGFFIITSGLILTGFFPLLLPKMRRVFKENFAVVRPLMYVFLFIELMNLIALAFAQRAIALGDPSLVAAVETTMPAHTFLLSWAMVFVHPRLNNSRVKKKLTIKIVLILAMTVGVWFVS